MISCTLVGCVSCGGLALWLAVTGRLGDGPSWIEPLAVVTAMAVGLYAPRAVFRHGVPARCGNPACTGRSRPQGNDPITYVCAACGDEEQTQASEADGPAADSLPID